MQQAPVVITVRVPRGEGDGLMKARGGFLSFRKVEKSVAQIRQRRGILRLQCERGAIDLYGFRGAFLRAKHHAEIPQRVDRSRFELDRPAQALGGFLVAPKPLQKEAQIAVDLPRGRLQGQRLPKRRFGTLEEPRFAPRQPELVVRRRPAGIERGGTLESLAGLRCTPEMEQCLAVVDKVSSTARIDSDGLAYPLRRRFLVALLRTENPEAVHRHGVAGRALQYLPVEQRGLRQVALPVQVLRPLQGPP